MLVSGPEIDALPPASLPTCAASDVVPRDRGQDVQVRCRVAGVAFATVLLAGALGGHGQVLLGLAPQRRRLQRTAESPRRSAELMGDD